MRRRPQQQTSRRFATPAPTTVSSHACPGPSCRPARYPNQMPAAEIRDEMRRIHVQRERRPRAPPFAGLHARRIDGADIERIEPPEPAGDGVPDEHERQRIQNASDPRE